MRQICSSFALASGTKSAASARPPLARNTGRVSRRIGPSFAASRRSTSTSRRSPDAIGVSFKGLKPYFEDYHKLKYTSDAIKAAVELLLALHP